MNNKISCDFCKLWYIPIQLNNEINYPKQFTRTYTQEGSSFSTTHVNHPIDKNICPHCLIEMLKKIPIFVAEFRET